MPPLILTLTIGIAITVVTWALWPRSSSNIPVPDIANVATFIVAIGAFIFGYLQWRSSRFEKSMEDFYSRLSLANHRRENVKLVSNILGHPWTLNNLNDDYEIPRNFKDHQWSMYVYSELDNLEYVVENYNLGYMQERHAIRGLRTFYQRCVRKPFRDRACKCVRCMAYNDSTIRVVKEVCKDIEKRAVAEDAIRQRKTPPLPKPQAQNPAPSKPPRPGRHQWTKRAAL